MSLATPTLLKELVFLVGRDRGKKRVSLHTAGEMQNLKLGLVYWKGPESSTVNYRELFPPREEQKNST